MTLAWESMEDTDSAAPPQATLVAKVASPLQPYRNRVKAAKRALKAAEDALERAEDALFFERYGIRDGDVLVTTAALYQEFVEREWDAYDLRMYSPGKTRVRVLSFSLDAATVTIALLTDSGKDAGYATIIPAALAIGMKPQPEAL